MEQITLPYKFTPRPYQIPLLNALDTGTKRAVVIWHRRSGKDKVLLNLVIKKMFQRVGAYFYFLPTYSQGEKIIWNGADKDGFRFLDHFPKELVRRKNDNKMLIETINGSLLQVIGTDNIDSIVGTNPVGCVFSEYSLQNPQAWNFIRPILAENGGWAVFNFTPRGKNHGYDLYEYAKNTPSWFCQKLTVDDTKAIPTDTLEQERIEMNKQTGDDSLFYQEYYCSFDVSVQGSYYGKQLSNAEREGRILPIPIDTSLPVDTWWDLGISDSTAIWFTQQVGMQVRVIDYFEASGEGLPFYAKVLQEKKYYYGRHYGPHDLAVRELGSGTSRVEIARRLGINFTIVPNLPIEDGIQAARLLIDRCYFDGVRCKQGLDALKNYHKFWDESSKSYRNRPVHDWSSHAADAFRYMAVGLKTSTTSAKPFIPRSSASPRKQSKIVQFFRDKL